MLTPQQFYDMIYYGKMVEVCKQTGGDKMNRNIPAEGSGGGFEAFSAMLSSATKSLERLKSKGMEEFGLSGTHTLCLRQLYDNPDGFTRTELASRLSVDRAQITRVIGELLEKGFVTEHGGGSGYRKKCILTEKGASATAEINSIVERINHFVSGDIPPDRLLSFYETLGEICENLKKAEDLL